MTFVASSRFEMRNESSKEKVTRVLASRFAEEKMMRIERAEDGDWVVMEDNQVNTLKFDDIPSPAKEKLALLLVAPVGYRDERVGRRVSGAVFWIFNRDEQEQHHD